MKLFYSPAYVASGVSFETLQKPAWIAESLRRSPIDGVAIEEPESLSIGTVEETHDPIYVSAIEAGEPGCLAESQGFRWDASLLGAVLASNGGVVAAAREALQTGSNAGSLSSGLHHARRETGCGFCTFNGLAIAAREAMHAGAERVLILDFDAHCGGGTAALIKGVPRIVQRDVSVDLFDHYAPQENAHLQVVTQAADWLPAICKQLDEAGDCDLCLYNAGVDPFEDDEGGGLQGITREHLIKREALVFDWARSRTLPVAFVLAGGYLSKKNDRAQLVALHRITLRVAAVTEQASHI
jgi:acetoin utilization deacetylase AcuC-like enzyme